MNTSTRKQRSPRAIASQDKVETFFRTLFEGLDGYLCVAQGPGRRKEEYFRSPESVGAAAEFAVSRNRAGADVYFCAHLLTDAIPRRSRKPRPERNSEDTQPVLDVLLSTIDLLLRS